MLWTDVEKNWSLYRTQFKSKWPKLTDTDLNKVGGHRDTLASMLVERQGFELPKAEKAIDEFVKTLKKPATAK